MNLPAFRAERSLTQREFGLMLDPPVSQPTVSMWERGEVSMSLDYAHQTERLSGGAVSTEECLALFNASRRKSDGALSEPSTATPQFPRLAAA